MGKEAKTRYSYQYDSVARAYAQPEPVKIPVTGEPKRKQRSMPAPKIEVAFGAQITLCGVIVFACCMFYIYSYSSLRIKQSELMTLKTQKITISNEITSVEAQITKKLDLETIRQRATKELGMKQPHAYQIHYIEMPEESYTTYHESK